jgi:CBS domain-containing protein
VIRYPDIANAIQVRHLQVPLEHAVTFDPDQAGDSALSILAARGFDRAPVLDGRSLLGLIEAARLPGVTGPIRDLVTPLRPEQMVSADAPVSQALEWLLDVPLLFVLSGRRVTGFFVQGDLNKQPTRLYFYLLVATLEIGLATQLRRWRGKDEDRLLDRMPAAVRQRALIAREEALKADTEVDLVAHLTLPEILRVVQRIDEIRVPLGSATRKHWETRTGALTNLRNAVMHPTRDLLGADRTLEDLVSLDALLRDLLAKLEDVTVA